mgnify:CR=1 FL=1
MKKTFLALLAIILTSCHPFGEQKVLSYKTELENLALQFQKYDNGTFDRDEIDEFLIGEIRDLNIDLVVKNGDKKNPSYSGFDEENDSLVIFIKKSNSLFDTEKRILFDYHKKPQNYGNNEISGASYSIVQLNERFYFSEEGFD